MVLVEHMAAELAVELAIELAVGLVIDPFSDLKAPLSSRFVAS